MIRIARAHTGRDRVVQIGYNGWLKLARGGRASAPRNDDGCRARRSGSPRGPAPRGRVGRPCHPRPPVPHPGFGDRGHPHRRRLPGHSEAAGFYRYLRDLADRHGALLAYDEMVTGFRVAIGGMAEATGVLPDLSVFGKGIANGMPLAVYCGRREVLGRGSTAARWSSRRPNGGETLSLAAATATMTAIRDRDVIARLLASRHPPAERPETRCSPRPAPAIRLVGTPACPQFVGADARSRPSYRAAFRHGLSFYRVVNVNAAHNRSRHRRDSAPRGGRRA